MQNYSRLRAERRRSDRASEVEGKPSPGDNPNPNPNSLQMLNQQTHLYRKMTAQVLLEMLNSIV